MSTSQLSVLAVRDDGSHEGFPGGGRVSRAGAGLSGRQRYALHVLDRCAALDDGWGVLSRETAVFDGQAFVHWRSAEALEARGLVEIDRDLGRLRRLASGGERAGGDGD